MFSFRQLHRQLLFCYSTTKGKLKRPGGNLVMKTCGLFNTCCAACMAGLFRIRCRSGKLAFFVASLRIWDTSKRSTTSRSFARITNDQKHFTPKYWNWRSFAKYTGSSGIRTSWTWRCTVRMCWNCFHSRRPRHALRTRKQPGYAILLSRSITWKRWLRRCKRKALR